MNGSIKIHIGGKDRGLKFNMRAIEEFAKVKQNSDSAISAAVTEVYAGLIGHCYQQQIEPDFTFADVVDWVDEMLFTNEGRKALADVDKCFSESRAFEYVTNSQKPAKKKK